jgi:predicted porin
LHSSLALLLASASLAAPLAHAQSQVTIYGRVDLGVDVTSGRWGSFSRVMSGGVQGSRLGFTGAEDLGGGLRAVFRLEQGQNADEGTLGQGGRSFGREASVGLSSATLGTVSLGRLPTPYYANQPFIDAFLWSGAGGMTAITRNTAGTSRQVLGTAVNARSDNAVNYQSPTLSGLVFRAQVAAGEGSASIGRNVGASVRYTSGALDLMAGANQQQGASNSNGSVRAASVGGSFDLGVARVYAGYTVEANDCTTCTGALARVVGSTKTDFRLVNLGVRVPLGSMNGIAQVVRLTDKSTYSAPTGERDATWLGIGVEYYLSRRTLVHFSVATIDNKNGSNYVLGSGSAQQPAGLVADLSRSTTTSLVLTHAF